MDFRLLTSRLMAFARRAAVAMFDSIAYRVWVVWCDRPSAKELRCLKSRISRVQNPPRISVIMPVFRPNRVWLAAAIRSVRTQVYPNWELCIAEDGSGDAELAAFLKMIAAEDPRIRVTIRADNGNIAVASNSAAALATGSRLALMDQDDLIPPHALAFIADAILAHPQAGLIYSDEDRCSARGMRFDPFFKPDFSIELLRGQNFVCHLAAYRKEVFDEIGGFRAGLDGAQDHDLALRISERLTGPGLIVHIPRILYHWRSNAGSVSMSADSGFAARRAARQAVAGHLQRTTGGGEVEILPNGYLRARLPRAVEPPLVSVLVPSRNRVDLLRPCLSSLQRNTRYPRIEIIVIDNGSDDPATLRYLTEIEGSGVTVLRRPGPFNFSALVNAGAAVSKGELLLLLNNDTEAINPGWLEEMVAFCHGDVGIVGARLWYPNGRLQHAGLVLCPDGVAHHALVGAPSEFQGYYAHAQLTREVSAVTGACMLVTRSAFASAGGFDEVNLPISLDDVDFCLRVRERGFRIIWTPLAELWHHESASRGMPISPEKQAREDAARHYMCVRWVDHLSNDPFYSPNLSFKRLYRPDFAPRISTRNDSLVSVADRSNADVVDEPG